MEPGGGWDDGGGWGDGDLPPDGWALRAAAWSVLWLAAVVAVCGLWGVAQLRVDCDRGARDATALSPDGMNAAKGCLEAAQPPWAPVVTAVVVGAAGAVAIVVGCRPARERALSSPDGRVRGRSARLREGW